MDRFQFALHNLRKYIPADYPVHVYIVDPKDMKEEMKDFTWGYSSFTGKRFTLRIAKAHIDIMIFILIHEWAHCVVNDCESKCWHGPKWGAAYAKCWKIVTEPPNHAQQTN